VVGNQVREFDAAALPAIREADTPSAATRISGLGDMTARSILRWFKHVMVFCRHASAYHDNPRRCDAGEQTFSERMHKPRDIGSKPLVIIDAGAQNS
jgi:hypothetical protein